MIFDPNTILSMTISDAMATELTPVPEGEWVGTINKIELQKAKLDSGEVPVLRVTWLVADPAVANITGRKQNTVTQDVWLDLTPEGTLDTSKGRNVQLGRLREAVGQNIAGRPWSFQSLVGQSARILVTHRTTDDGTIYAQVRKVSKL